MSIEALEKAVIEWAKERDLYRLSCEKTRFAKFMEEVNELINETWPPGMSFRDMEAMKLEAGDVIVTLINFLHPYGLDLETCLSAAYEKIKDRTGHMENGTFVRDRGLN